MSESVSGNFILGLQFGCSFRARETSQVFDLINFQTLIVVLLVFAIVVVVIFIFEF